MKTFYLFIAAIFSIFLLFLLPLFVAPLFNNLGHKYDRKTIREINVLFIDFDPPKHAHAILDINGTRKEIHIAKHCSNWESLTKNKIGKFVSVNKVLSNNRKFIYYFFDSDQEKQFCE